MAGVGTSSAAEVAGVGTWSAAEVAGVGTWSAAEVVGVGTWTGPIREERQGGVHRNNVVIVSQYLVYKTADEGVQTLCAFNPIFSSIHSVQI